MSSLVKVLVIFIVFQISSQSLVISNLGYARFNSNPSNANLREERNVQLLVPVNAPDLDSNEEHFQQLVVASKINKYHLASPNHKKQALLVDKNHVIDSDLKVAPENVIRVQEITGLLWPLGVVPYFIESDYDNATMKRIVKAMSIIESVSCVVFKELDSKPTARVDAWLHFTNPRKERECRHSFAEVYGASEVVLGYDCLRPEEILHSLLHALGFRDEVTHLHRDQYIRVLWENIQPKYRDLYRIRYEDTLYKLVEYDPMSIMHFHDRAFSDNGGPTIVAKVPGLQITYTTTLSQLDIMRLKLAFSHECNKRNLKDLLDTCKNTLSNKNGPKSDETVDVQDYQTNLHEPKEITVSNEYYHTDEEEGAEQDYRTDSDNQAKIYQNVAYSKNTKGIETENAGDTKSAKINVIETLKGDVDIKNPSLVNALNNDRIPNKFISIEDYIKLKQKKKPQNQTVLQTTTGVL